MARVPADAGQEHRRRGFLHGRHGEAPTIVRKPYKVLARAVRLLRADYNSETILKALALVTTTYVKNGKTDRRAHRAGLEQWQTVHGGTTTARLT
jgi:hypothetical protein